MSEKILVIVESPAKSKTLQSFLSSNYTVMASVGHIIEIKDGGKYCNCGIDPTNNFKANYQISQDKEKVVKDLKEQVQRSDKVILCSDPDREGESIAWSLKEFLNIPEGKYTRATFHEITKNAVLKALENTRDIDYNLVNAADARRKIDKILGYRLSPIGKKYVGARSIGRCQSAGLKLVIDREKEINEFVPEEYWELYLHFVKNKKEYKAKYVGTVDKKVDRINSKDDLDKIIKDCEDSPYDFTIRDIITKEKLSNTKPPFTTSTFQQEVSNKLGISVKNAMSCAQKLFEGINVGGEHIALITYIRTDSDDMSLEFQDELKSYIKENYGDKYLGTLKQGKKVENAQEGHECLRCVDLNMTPERLSKHINDKYLLKVYSIIYKRTVASMMTPEIISETTYNISNDNKHLFNFVTKEQLFDGYKKVYTFEKDDESDDDNNNMNETFQKDEVITVINMEDVQKFTQPPSRYTEGTLISKLEDTGIGRPSTLVPIVSTITDDSRGYCIYNEKKLQPTDRGTQLSEFLDDKFPDIININYTSEMEKKLDDIASGKVDEILILNDFYNKLESNVDEVLKTSNYVKKEVIVAENVKCPLCGSEMFVRQGRFGEFYGCSKYPKCKGVMKVEKEENNS